MDPDYPHEDFQHVNPSVWDYFPENDNFTHPNYTMANNCPEPDPGFAIEEGATIEQVVTASTDTSLAVHSAMGWGSIEPVEYSQHQLATELDNFPGAPLLDLDSLGPADLGLGPVSDSLNHVSSLA
ncbi:hypothetical protein PG999_007382 [Apiospora kogelbergensis]|uniref:Uncharacterized protein n=1 Tax=Apiospora kogelbergensis TaxID=1337665 RepID=A0AAW0QY67_9PEZI